MRGRQPPQYAIPHGAVFTLQLDQVRQQAVTGRRQNGLRQRRVDGGHEYRQGHGASCEPLRKFGLPGAPVPEVGPQELLRFLDDRAMRGQHPSGCECQHALERPQVGGHVSLGTGRHYDRGVREHQVTRDEPVVVVW